MTFRKATQSDAVRCLEIYDAVSDWEVINGRQTCWERGGQAFMANYAGLARGLGCKALRLDTVSSNQKSQAMYKKLGFWETGRWEGDPNGVGCTLVFVGLEKNAN